MIKARKNLDSAQPTVSVLVPAYNEEKTIGTVLTKLLSLNFVKEVIVVDDCSTDGTAAVVNSLTDSRIRYFKQPKNRGKTAAILRALPEISGDVVIIQDADLEYDPSEVPHVVEPILLGHADVVYGSRFLVRRAARVLYYYHRVANYGLTTFPNMLTNLNLTDVETGYKAFRADIIRGIPLASKGFGMEIELTASMARLGIRIYEVPTLLRTHVQKKERRLAFGTPLRRYSMSRTSTRSNPLRDGGAGTSRKCEPDWRRGRRRLG